MANLFTDTTDDTVSHSLYTEAASNMVTLDIHGNYLILYESDILELATCGL